MNKQFSSASSPEENGGIIFKAEHIIKEFPNLRALDDVSTEIKRGEVVFIVGPSGSGKSTFLRCLNLLEKPTDGKIFFEGKQISCRGIKINAFRQKVGMVFQHFNLFPHLTILNNISDDRRFNLAIKNQLN